MNSPRPSYVLSYYSTFTHLPALVSCPVESELLLDPDVDLAQRHLLLGVGHGQADEGCIRVRRLGALVHREVTVLES